MVSEKKFRAYLNVQKIGLTNMFDLSAVIFLSAEIYEVKLTWNDCLFIMKHYPQLRKGYEEAMI